MAKTIFEELGGKYERQGDYLIPCIALPAEEEQPIGVWGQRHLDYLKQSRKVTYMNLLTSGRLNAYLADIDKQAEDMFSRLVKEYADRQGVTERLKDENQLLWVQKMNNIRALVREVVGREIIYS
ncbi:TnpV protein [Enterocloster clostridioformis]|uniref:TnpV protein n=1 Tax=Enterocloster clostridioformis TaxID=1531 RepID=UPI002675B1E5|nr:TnpV protein [Enterocloster clostridioformis]